MPLTAFQARAIANKKNEKDPDYNNKKAAMNKLDEKIFKIIKEVVDQSIVDQSELGLTSLREVFDITDNGLTIPIPISNYTMDDFVAGLSGYLYNEYKNRGFRTQIVIHPEGRGAVSLEW